MTTPTGSVRYDSFVHAAEATGLSRNTVKRYCLSGAASQGRSFAYVDNEPLPGEVFKNITPEDLALLGRKKKHAHLVATTRAESPAE